MGGLMSRNKGKRAERAVIELLQPIVDHVYHEAGKEPIVLKRNSLQSDGGGYDIFGLSWLALEVKHQEVEHLNDWWKQTVEQAGRDKTPVLFYKKNNVAFRVRMEGTIGADRVTAHKAVVDIDTEAFCWWFYLRLKQEVETADRRY